jgi:hypothetical protein
MNIVEVILLTIQGQHLTLRCCPQKRLTPTGYPSTRSNYRESEPPTGNHHRRHRKEKFYYLHMVNQQAKPEQLILSKCYPTSKHARLQVV